ncbi:PREDICTED: uncharacterized protein LOC108518251 isoform X3 [Rhinopithecus bieti]|uniref:uncharacterized protein LOC108518251 isoform X3 n=1 Tax=Rhinopithecus bieti TaxID=61621 RepID=UPI00083C8720|nr:PREDICTED: uncharacterized protein LOC108518251 isoform X3 [Rhinopithecus bieti]
MRPHYLQSSWPWTSCDQAGPPQQRPPGGRPMSKKDTEILSLGWRARKRQQESVGLLALVGAGSSLSQEKSILLWSG